MFKNALSAARRPDEKKLLLAGLAEVRTIESLQVVAQYLDDEALRAEAALAAAKIACPQRRRDRGLRGPEVTAVLEKALEFIETDEWRQQVERHIGQ